MNIADFLKKFNPIERMRYYKGELLVAEDFIDEQRYHRNMRYIHNHVLHGAGIVEGLQVTKKGAKSIEVSPGVAISASGRELVLAQSKTLDVSGTGKVTVRICAVDDPPETTTGNDQVGKRTTERVEIKVGPCLENSVDSIELTQFNLDGGGNVPTTIPYAVGTLSVAQMETRLQAIEAQLKPTFYRKFVPDVGYRQFRPAKGKTEYLEITIYLSAFGRDVSRVEFVNGPELTPARISSGGSIVSCPWPSGNFTELTVCTPRGFQSTPSGKKKIKLTMTSGEQFISEDDFDIS